MTACPIVERTMALGNERHEKPDHRTGRAARDRGHDGRRPERAGSSIRAFVFTFG